MSSSGLLGLLMGLTLFPFMYFGPRPYAQVLVGSLVFLALVTAAVLTWRRTGLRLASVSMLTASVAMALFTRILVLWRDLFAVPPPDLIAFGAIAVLAGAFMLAQPRTAPQAWHEWRQHLRTVSFADMLRFRHIPQLPRARSNPPP